MLILYIGCCDCEEILDCITTKNVKDWGIHVVLLEAELYDTVEQETYCKRCFAKGEGDRLRESSIFCATLNDVPM
jgi:hypothetical protein